MTTTTVAPELRVELDPLRVLTIAANLLPGEITDARRERKLRIVVAAALVVVLALLVGWDVMARGQTSSASSALKQANVSIAALQKDQGGFADLNRVKAANQAITAELQGLMAKDLPFYTLLPEIRAAAPSGVTVTDIQVNVILTTSGVANSTSGASPTLGSASTIGSIELVGYSPDKPHIGAYLNALSKVKGLTDVYFQSAISQKTGYQFTINVELTSAALGGRYSATTNSTTGAH